MADDHTESRERLLDWLRDAHAMEKQAETMLTGMEGRIENYPLLRRRISQHVKETETQAQRLEGCIKALDGSTSAMKDITGRMAAMGQALTGSMAGDEVMKGALAGYAFEHFEIGSYRILIAAAEALGEKDVAQVCRQNLREEEDMAQWLSQNIDQLTAQYLDREDRGSERAKR